MMLYKLYNTCLITIGVVRSLIVDTERSKYYFIPNSFAILMHENNGLLDSGLILAELDPESQGYFREYCEFLLNNDLVFEVSSYEEAERFPVYPTAYFTPFEITNAILTISRITIANLSRVIQQVKDLKIPHIELRVEPGIFLSELDALLTLLHTSQAKAIDIYIPFGGQTEMELSVYLNQFLKIVRLYLYQSSQTAHAAKDKRIVYLAIDSIHEKHCGVVSEYYFSPNARHYTESLQYNSCLNQKISVDRNGEIKNCPSMNESFGNIENTTLKEALRKVEFKKDWNISKDQITTCKDCEFRHICTDCRAYLENPEDVYSKPLKCGYDPYTCEWEQWSVNPIKQKAIAYYGLTAFEANKDN